MKQSKVLAWALSLAMMFTMSPGITGYAAEKRNTIRGESADIVLLAANTGWQPKPTRSVSSASAFPTTLNNGDVLQINGPVEYSAPEGVSPITLAAGADAKIIINGKVTLHGANASKAKGATAAIRVPQGAKLTIYSAHDEALSTSKAAPKDTLTVTGGNAANGADGGNGKKADKETYLSDGTHIQTTTYWATGAGGNGGGGAAAAIGGNGGNGGAGAASEQSPQYMTVDAGLGGRHYYDSDNRKGANGKKGGVGSTGESAGNIYIIGRLTLTATGGNAASGGSGGSGSLGYMVVVSGPAADYAFGGAGGGGGGGGGCAAPAIGAGGAGGSGGGSGGHPSADHAGNAQGCGGGGGGGAWPNGGGGGGGGSECSDAKDENDKHSYGGSGGSGGGVYGSGRSGSAGTSTGTKGHGYNNNRYDAEPGSGGSGGTGLQGLAGSGGRGGTEKDKDHYDAGAGGGGGDPVTLQSWNKAGNLVISTAVNFKADSYGNGGGKGTMSALSPYVIYDLMDCKVTLSPAEYTYTGKRLRPAVQSVTYSASTDRDAQQIPGSASSISSSGYSALYGENIHCPSGTVSVLGNQDSSRTTVRTNGAVVGSTVVSFKINKAQLLTAPISLIAPNPYINQSVTATLKDYTSLTAGSGQLADLLRESSKKAEGPQVTWSMNSDTSGYFTEKNGLQAKFALTSGKTASVRATLSDMNDFEDCTFDVSLTVRALRTWSTALSADTPHPRVPISVILPTGVSSATYQWYVGGTKVNGATAQSYTPSASDIGKSLTVVVVPSADSGYAECTVTATNKVEDHGYDANGFCTVCDEYQPAAISGGVYSITNGGQMFWFAALANGDGTHVVFTEKNAAASALLTKDIDLENREWTPIGKYGNNYTGNFNGQGHTVSKLRITKTNASVGLFGRTTGTIRDFTVDGNITLSGAGSRIGGAVGTAYGGTISGIISKVNISDAGYASSHFGGVVGGVDSVVSTIERCMYFGEINITASTDCIGGIVGYTNGGARIGYCANLGTVRTSTDGAYTGGILGYVNNEAPSLRNCYNYGTVQNGNGSRCGAIVGWMRKHTASKYTDNCYLIGSAPAAFGSGSSTTAKVYAKEAAAFESGEVCYLVNGSSSAEDVIWRQDIDNGNTPYDTYPVYEGGIVLRNLAHHDCTAKSDIYAYSNSAAEKDHINHNYINGFCTCCDALQPAVQTNGTYLISNGGQLFWFAEQINSGTVPQNSAAALNADIDLEGSNDGQAADYAGVTKMRNFPGVGTADKRYKGSFTGNGYTVSDLYILRESKANVTVEGVGLFGFIENAAVTGLTVKGKVSVRRDHSNGEVKRIGGIVGSAYNAKLSELISYVDVTGTGSYETQHMGGVAGDITDGSDAFKCMNFGSVYSEKTKDCVGGVVGYINDVSIRYCANHGSVKTDVSGGYVGGVSGYLNNGEGIMRNCYNYGKVQNGGGSCCGAVIGWLRTHTAANITDNYFLTDSAASAFGGGSYSTTVKAIAKDNAVFASGEVCYLVNGSTSTGEGAVWKQDIDNGNKPYDIYPVYDAAAVYFRSDNTYSNYPESISVTISWGAMEFDYNEGRWDPDTHKYNGGWTASDADADKLTVRNDSNVALNVEISFTADVEFSGYNLTGSFSGVSSGPNRTESGAEVTAKLALRSLAPESIKGSGKKKLGDITVQLTTIGGGNR